MLQPYSTWVTVRVCHAPDDASWPWRGMLLLLWQTALLKARSCWYLMLVLWTANTFRSSSSSLILSSSHFLQLTVRHVMLLNPTPFLSLQSSNSSSSLDQKYPSCALYTTFFSTFVVLLHPSKPLRGEHLWGKKKKYFFLHQVLKYKGAWLILLCCSPPLSLNNSGKWNCLLWENYLEIVVLKDCHSDLGKYGYCFDKMQWFSKCLR